MTKEQFLTQFFSLLNKNSIDYFVYGEYRYLPRDTGSSDIDIVVNCDDIELFDSIIKKTVNDGSVVLAAFYKNPTTKFYRFITKEWGVQIDVFFCGLRYKGCEYFPHHYLKKYIIEHNSIKVLSLEKGFYVGFFKEVIHNGRVKEKYLDAFLREFSENNKECCSEIQDIYGDKILCFIKKHSKKNDLIKSTKLLQKLMIKKVMQGHLISFLLNKISVIFRLFCKRPGYVIVVEGTDGSGKSFIINSITPIVNEAFHNGVVYNHLRPNWLPDIAVVLGKRKKPKEGQEVKVVSDPHAGKQSGFVMSLVRWGWYMLDYTLGFLKKVWLPIHSRSKVFIFDRFYYEFYLDQKRSHVKLPNWIVRVGEFFLPKPDLILCLGGDPEKIYARKPETSLEEVKRQTAVLKEFCDKRKNAVWIDTTVKPEESIEAAMQAITAMMSKRFKIDDVR